MPLPSPRDLHALRGAIGLARFDPAGLAHFDGTPEDALRSFRAALYVLPAYFVLFVLRDGSADLSARFVAVEIIAYVMTYTAFAALMVDITALLGRSDHYFRFLAAYNWASVIQVAVYVPILLIAEGGGLPASTASFIVVITMLGILAYQGYITCIALNVGALLAGLLVFIDLVVAIAISGVAETLATAKGLS